MSSRAPRVLAALTCILAASVAAAEARAEPDLQPWRDAVPPCDASVTWCFGLQVYVSPDAATEADDDLVITPEWLAAHVAYANAKFAALGVGYELAGVRVLEANEVDIVTKSDRDALGHDRWAEGAVYAFFVGSLANVDEEGMINGVHWRDRDDTSHRWVIVSSQAPWTGTLTHELGHYFELSHSDYEESLMNTSMTIIFDLEALSFHQDELDAMRPIIEARVESEALVPR